MAKEIIIKVGDKISYKGAWGLGEATTAQVTSITKTEMAGEKYGDDVDQISFSDLDRAVFSLDDHHWCYGYQVHGVMS